MHGAMQYKAASQLRATRTRRSTCVRSIINPIQGLDVHSEVNSMQIRRIQVDSWKNKFWDILVSFQWIRFQIPLIPVKDFLKKSLIFNLTIAIFELLTLLIA